MSIFLLRFYAYNFIKFKLNVVHLVAFNQSDFFKILFNLSNIELTLTFFEHLSFNYSRINYRIHTRLII